MRKLKVWLKSAAGIVSIWLLGASILLLVLACSPWGNFSARTSNNINNILFGFGTNLIGIIVTVSFVQFFLDKQSEKTELTFESEKILRFDRVMQILIQHYVMYFNTITTPMDQRNSISTHEIKQDFCFADMKDLYLQSLFLRNKGYEPAIVAFYDAELELRKYCIEITSQVDFKHHPDLLNDLTQFVEVSLAFDVRNAVLGNMSLNVGERKYIDVIKEYMADSAHDWVSEIHDEKSHGNMMYPYVCLFDMLNWQKSLIVQYLTHIKALKDTLSSTGN